VNHNVQAFISGCFTLKFSGSWKTVTVESSVSAPRKESVVSLDLLSAGDIGMVSSGTGCCEFVAVARSAMMGWRKEMNKIQQKDLGKRSSRKEKEGLVI
jgi:hypothetical protein